MTHPDPLRSALQRALRWFELVNDGDMGSVSIREADLIEADLRAALASPQGRETVIEECAQVAQQWIDDWIASGIRTKHLNAGSFAVEVAKDIVDAIRALKSSAPDAWRATHNGEVVWLREVDAGTDNACWVISNRVDPVAVPFFAGIAAPPAEKI